MHLRSTYSQKKDKKKIHNEKNPLTTTNINTEVAGAGAHSKLCFPAFMSIELKVSA